MKGKSSRKIGGNREAGEKRGQPFFKPEHTAENSFFQRMSLADAKQQREENKANNPDKVQRSEEREKPDVQRGMLKEEDKTPAVQKATEPEKEKVQRTADDEKQVQKKGDEEDKGTSPPVMKKEGQPQGDAKNSTRSNADIAATIDRKKGNGKKMNDKSRMEMEHAFGKDFKDVNVHTDDEAKQLNRELNARAFTTGSDIYFAEGQLNEETNAGKKLLAHELTHVVQQSKK